MRFSLKGIGLLVLLLCLGFLMTATGCGCGDDDDDDSGAPDDDTGDDDTGDDDTGDDDTVPDSPVLDYPPDETFELSCLSAEARVALDQYGIPYLFAGSRGDLGCVLGYMEAEYRMFQMDFVRHLAEGRLTEYVGDLALDTDIYNRIVFMANDGTSVIDKIAASLDPDVEAFLQTFADGVNAWLERKRAEFPETFWPIDYVTLFTVHPDDVPDWEVRDTVAIARYQTWDLSGSLGDELDLSEWATALSPDLFNQLLTRAPATDTVVVQPEDIAKKSARNAEAYRLSLPEGYRGLSRAAAWVRGASAIKPYSPDGEASNNWIISPDINAGTGFLANDPHLSLTYPSVFLLGLIDTKELGDGDIRTWGAFFPGTPSIVIGANENLAWGETVAGFDVLDVYFEELILDGGDPSAVVFDGGNVDLVVSSQSFGIAGEDDPTVVDIYVVPHHGPILPDSIDGTTALSFKWTGHEPSYEVTTFLDLAVAETVDEGFTAIEDFKVGAQNFVLQDTAGDIGYFPHADVPLREWDLSTHRPWLALPGDGTAEWDGFIPAAQIPKIKNPDRGFLLTSNNDINGTLQSGDPTDGDYYWYYERAIGYRAQRVDELLTALAESKGFTLDDMKATQTDVRANYARDVIPFVQDIIGLDISDLSADAQAILASWDGWDFVLDSGLEGSDPAGPASSDADERANAVAAMGFGMFEVLLKNMAFGDELADAGVVDYPYGRSEFTVAILGLLDDTDDPLWDNIATDADVEAARDIVVAALNQAATDIAALEVFDGAPVDEWYWGRAHYLILGHLAFAAFDIHIFDKGPYAIPGGLYTVNVASYPEDGESFVTTKGPSLRIIHEFTGGALTTNLHLPGGEIPVMGDPHELDLLQLWLDYEYYEIPTAVDSILDATQYMYAFTPEG